MQKELIENTLASAGATTTYTGAGTIGVGWLLSSEAAVVYGVFIGLVGVVIQLIFGRRKDKREAVARHEAKAAHEADMRERELRIELLRAGRLTRSEDES